MMKIITQCVGIPTDDANRTLMGNVPMQVVPVVLALTLVTIIQIAPPGGQTCNQCKLRHLVAEFVTNASRATWWFKKNQLLATFTSHVSSAIWMPNLQPMQVAWWPKWKLIQVTPTSN